MMLDHALIRENSMSKHAPASTSTYALLGTVIMTVLAISYEFSDPFH